MTSQEAFDTVYTHFIINDGPFSVDEHEQCRYRGPGGEKCAAGVLIPDHLYDTEMEGRSIEGLLMTRTELLEYFSGVNGLLLHSLQCAHDTAYGRGQDKALMKQKLVGIARYHSLTIPEENEAAL